MRRFLLSIALGSFAGLVVIAPADVAVDYLGPLPAEIQTTTIWSAGRRGKSEEAEAASALLQYFASPDARAAFKKSGMDPAT